VNPNPPSDRQILALRWPLRRAIEGKNLGSWRSNATGDGMEISTVREYNEGDDARRISSSATARMGSLHVVVPVAERSLTTELLLDGSLSMGTGSTKSKITTALQATETLIRIAAGHSDRVDLRITGETLLATGSLQGKSAIIAAKSFISKVKLGNSNLFTSQLLSTLSRRTGLLILISDWRDYNDRVSLSKLSRLREVIVVQVIDASEEFLPNIGLIKVIDPESGRVLQLDTDNQNLRNTFHARAEQLQKEINDSAKGAIAHIIIRTQMGHGGTQVVNQLLTKKRIKL
jgi:hypothetical protein